MNACDCSGKGRMSFEKTKDSLPVDASSFLCGSIFLMREEQTFIPSPSNLRRQVCQSLVLFKERLIWVFCATNRQIPRENDLLFSKEP